MGGGAGRRALWAINATGETNARAQWPVAEPGSTRWWRGNRLYSAGKMELGFIGLSGERLKGLLN